MNDIYYILMIFLLSMTGTWWVFKKVLRIAIMKNIVDNPDARKLQRRPVPVLGGVAVFFGICFALMFSRLFFDCSVLFSILPAMVVILYLGSMDDVLSLTPRIRFLFEIVIVLVFIFANHFSIDNFHCLWGVEALPGYVAVPLTVFAAVGIINAINLIDGVNGLSSGFCIVTSLLYGIVFYMAGDISVSVLMFASAGALIPFYFHNVFGQRSKMFIGDGGTLLLGLIFSAAVVCLLRTDSPFSQMVDENFGIIAFSLATLAIPVFDTLRVMSTRMLNHKSPFNPDKTHLHHLLLDVKFSHIGVTFTEITLNLLIVFFWWLSYRLGASIDVQLYVVVIFGFLFTFGLYHWVRHLEKKQNKVYSRLCAFGLATHLGQTVGYRTIRMFLDRNVGV